MGPVGEFLAKLSSDDVVLVATNDIHAHLAEDKENQRLGLAKLLGFINLLRKSPARVHVVDCGDAFSGDPFGWIDNGRMVALVLGAIGFEAMTMGNHDLDYSVEEANPFHLFNQLIPTMNRKSLAKTKLLAQDLLWQGKPVIGAFSEPIVLGPLKSGGRLLVVGVHNPHTCRKSLKEALGDFDFGLIDGDLKRTFEKIAKKLKNSLSGLGPKDLVVVLSHLGGLPSEWVEFSGASLALLPGVSVVIDGHSHCLCGPRQIGKAIYVNAGHRLEAVTCARATGAGDLEVKLFTYNDLKEIKPDEKLSAVIEALSSHLGLDELITTLPFSFGGRLNDRPAFGRLAIWAILDLVSADAAYLNDGAVAGGLNQGKVTRRDLMAALPYKDKLLLITLPGELLIEAVVRSSSTWRGGWPFWAGIKVKVKKSDNFSILEVTDFSGKTIDREKNYRLIISDQALRRLGRDLAPKGSRPEVLGRVDQAAASGLAQMSEDRLRALANLEDFIIQA
ncbi:MAG: 5'-nucleotidase C-terminal domain-containing protein [Deltaproteobacteria bacterium]|jgi:5'-nucleotidase|nr:5'-nucleotidase C-terminal domain-containing protein [Deltaproteobacteria bacterium]